MAFSNTRSIGRQGEQLWTRGQGSALIVNNDLTNPLYVSNDSSISSSNVTVPPLGSMAVDGSIDWFGSTLSNSVTIQVQIMPGATQWSPSPAQVAAQINALGLAKDTTVGSVVTNTTGVAKDASVNTVNATLGTPAQDSIRTAIPNNISTTGVPLLTQSSVLAQSASTVIASNGVLTIPASGTLALNQIGFEFLLTAIYNAANGTNPFLTIVIDFIDSVTGLLVDQTTYVTVADGFGSAGGAWPTRIKGPTKANSCRINVFNLDTAQAIKVGYTFLVNSRPYTEDAIDWLVNGFIGLPGSIPGHTIPSFTLPDTNTLAVVANTSLGVSATDSWIISLQIGPLYLNIWETGVAGANIAVSGQPIPATVYGSNTPWLFNDVMGAGNPNKYQTQFFAGRSPFQVNIKNNGSVAASYTLAVTSGDAT